MYKIVCTAVYLYRCSSWQEEDAEQDQEAKRQKEQENMEQEKFWLQHVLLCVPEKFTCVLVPVIVYLWWYMDLYLSF